MSLLVVMTINSVCKRCGALQQTLELAKEKMAIIESA